MKSFLKLASMMIIACGVMLNAEGMNNTAGNNQQGIQSNPKDPYIALNSIAKVEVEYAKQHSLTKEQCIENAIRSFLGRQQMLTKKYCRQNTQYNILDEPAVRNALPKIIEWKWNPVMPDLDSVYYDRSLNIRVAHIGKEISCSSPEETIIPLVVQSSPDDPYMVAKYTVKALVVARPPVIDQQAKECCTNLAIYISRHIIETDLVDIFGESKVVILEERLLRDYTTLVVNDVFNKINRRRLERAQIRIEADNRCTNNHRH